MRLLDILRRYLSGELPRTCNLNTIIVYGKTDGEVMLLPPAMAQSIDKGFSLAVITDLKMFLPFGLLLVKFGPLRRKGLENRNSIPLEGVQRTLPSARLVVAGTYFIRADKPCHP